MLAGGLGPRVPAHAADPARPRRLLVFSVYALGRHRDDTRQELATVSADVELALTGIARDRLAALERLAFDQADVGRQGLRTTPPASGLGLDPGEGAAWPFNDIDDVHGFTEELAAVVGTGTVPVTVSYSVRFVDPLAPQTASASPTMAKEVAVRASEALTPGERARASVELKRVFTPAGMLSALAP